MTTNKILLLALSLYALFFSASAFAAGYKTPFLESNDGIMECGRYYYEAQLKPIPTQSKWSTSSSYRTVFKNKSAQAVCGGEVVDAAEISENRGSFSTEPPRFLGLKKVNRATVGILSKKTVNVGQTYSFACYNKNYSAQVLDLRYGFDSFVSLKFNDANAESLCGDGRFHKLKPLIEATEKNSQKSLGFN